MGSAPKLIIRASSVIEEVENIWNCLNYYRWQINNGYSPILPKHPSIEQLKKYSLRNSHLQAKDKVIIKGLMQYFYDKYKYDLVVKSLKKLVKIILPKMQFLLKLNKEWGFLYHKKYEVLITFYGTGGAYIHQTGIIILSVKPNGQFNYNPIHTILHEMVHIGIEKFIEHFKLNHTEKERVVDLYCSKLLSLHSYKMQHNKVQNIDKFLESNNFNLPRTLQEYIKEHPR